MPALKRVPLRLLVALLLAAAGCRAPAGRFSSGDASAPYPHCSLVFARQIVEDSAIEATCHPLRTGVRLVAEPADHLWTASRGAVGKRLLMRLHGSPQPLASNRKSVDADALEKELDAALGSQLEPASIRLYPEGTEALASLLNIIDSARERIDVLMFQWENDALGADLAERIAQRASPNLRVRLLIDGGGNLIFGLPARHHSTDVNAVLARLAETPHVELVRIRNPFGRVDHRKLVLVDGRIAWTGGRNFTHQSFFGQRDMSFTVEGNLVQNLQGQFDRFWHNQGGSVTEIEQARLDHPEEEIRPASLHAALAGSSPVNARARLVCTAPLNHQIETILYHAVDRAEHHIYMENYTFCDSLLVFKLAEARRRGADVRVVLSFNDATRALNRANRVIANRLLAAGVRVYVYPGLPHTKAAVVDGCWAYLGSGNFDPLSLRRNLEMGIAVSDCPLVQEVEQTLFVPDLREDWELKKPLTVSPADYLCEVFASFCL
jgi:cardiolipin synthase